MTLLGWILAASVAGLITVMIATHRVSGPAPLPSSQFAHLAAVQRADSRPPSLYVIVRDDAWQAMDDAARRALIDEVAGIAGSKGYRGIQFSTTRGAMVAQWLAKTGARLFVPQAAEAGEAGGAS
jgi:hypothetical protein